MKKMIIVSLLTLALNATAGWGGNNNPWGNNNFSNGPWVGSNNSNGIIDNNPYSMLVPDWFSEEMGNMTDEFDSNNRSSWGDNGWNNNSPWGNKGFNNNLWNNRNFNNDQWNNSNFGNSPWSNNSWRSTPWRNYGYNRPIPTTADIGTK